MAEGGSDEIIDKQVCGLCLETYMKEPKLLACFHSFCLKCLEEYVKENVQDNTFQCPLCSDSIDLPGGGVRNFETNIYIDIEALSKLKHHCDICGPDVDATNQCIECNENYCKRCTETHSRMKLGRSHSLINIDLSGDKRSVTKTLYCEKHTKEEVKVICKDCDTMLCLVCKLTDHEKHTSIDISDEAKNVMNNMQQKVQEMYENVTILEDVKQRQRDTEQEINKRKRRELEKVKQYKKGLEILLAKRMENTEDFITNTFDCLGANISISMEETKKAITSYRNWALQVEKMMKISDNVSMIKYSRAIQTSNEKVKRKLESYSKSVPEESLKQCQFSLTDHFLNHTFSPFFMKETVKSVSKISGLRDSELCYSLSVFQKSCFAFCFGFLKIANPPFSQFDNVIEIPQANVFSRICVLRGDCHYSNISDKTVKVWKQIEQSSKTVAKFEMYPRGIVYRIREDYEEFLVCLTENEYGGKGLVRVVPLSAGQAAYDFLPETDPGPSRIAVNRANGLVCLGYNKKLSIHSEDGTLIQTYDHNYMGLSDSFWPYEFCFDNENCIIIADKGTGTYDSDQNAFRQDGQVLRVNIFGKVLQVLLKGCFPTAVAVSHDDKLWVAYRDKNVTVYQMRNA